MVENPGSIHTPFQGKRPVHPTLPQAKRGINSPPTPEASPESIIPGYIPPYTNSADETSGAYPPGHGAIYASNSFSFASTRTTDVDSAAPNRIHEDLRASRNGRQMTASRMYNHIGPPSTSHPPAVVSRVHETSLEEPVEEGLMSRHASTPLSSTSMPPPYSHG
jgi:hypothetical protein